MKKSLLLVLLLPLLLACVETAHAQSTEFRDAKAHLGAAVGVFTYHGPINLLGPESKSNFTRHSNAGTALLGSFPILKKWLHFRFMLLFTNFDTSDGERLVGSGENEFLTKNLLLFEPELVFNLRSLAQGRVLPYVFTGFGGTIADVFGNERNVIDMPGTGIPGPERSAFHIPVGFGLDVSVSDCVSVFGEASWRFDLNYAFRNERNYDAHNTSLVMGGIRTCIRDSFRKNGPVPPPPYTPPPVIKPPKDPKLGHEKACWLKDLTPIYFKDQSADLGEAEKTYLDDDVVALYLKNNCCAEIVGYASAALSVTAIRLANARAKTVRDYLLKAGLSPSRFTINIVTIEETCKLKGMACPSSMFVQIIPSDCAD